MITERQNAIHFRPYNVRLDKIKARAHLRYSGICSLDIAPIHEYKSFSSCLLPHISEQLSTVFKTVFKHSTVVLLTAFAYIPSMICHTVYCTVMYFAGLQHKNPELDYVMILYVMSLHHPVGVCGASIILGPC